MEQLYGQESYTVTVAVSNDVDYSSVENQLALIEFFEKLEKC